MFSVVERTANRESLCHAPPVRPCGKHSTGYQSVPLRTYFFFLSGLMLWLVFPHCKYIRMEMPHRGFPEISLNLRYLLVYYFLIFLHRSGANVVRIVNILLEVSEAALSVQSSQVQSCASSINKH